MATIRVKDEADTLFDALQYTGSNAEECFKFSPHEELEEQWESLIFVDEGSSVDPTDWLVKELTEAGEDAEKEIQVYTNTDFESEFTIVTG